MERPERFDQLLASLGSPVTSSARRLPPRHREELPAIPDHELIRCIGQGAYGEVWLARSVLGAYRAIKMVFRDSFSSDQPYEREFRGIQRFEPVSRTNDGLMDILQVGRNDAQGCFYYVMELADCVDEEKEKRGRGEDENADGDASARHLSSAPLPLFSSARYIPRTLASELHHHRRLIAADCVQLGLSLTSALGHLHRHGLIHRDIKPSNIIFVQGVPKLADIGLVVEIEEAFSFVGTEGYIPPEGPTSPQADLYSLGKVLYEASNGKDRKEYPEPMTGLRELPDRSEQEMLLELNAVILKGCAEDVRERYQSAEEFQADLALIQSGKSVRRRRRLETRVAVLTRVALVVSMAALVGFGGYALQRKQTAAAKRLSEENSRLAAAEGQQRARAENALLDTQLQRADLLKSKDSAAALALFARLLRHHPTNRFIAEQILSTLSRRNFALPIATLSQSNKVGRARFTADGSRLVTASTNGTAHVWDARTGQFVSSVQVFEHGVNAVQISPDGEWVAMAHNGEVRIASARTGKVERSFPLEGEVSRLALNPDNSRLLVVQDSQATILDSQTGRRLIGPMSHGGKIDSATFSRAGDRVLTSSSKDSAARLWDALDGRLIGVFEHAPSPNVFASPRLSPDGTRVVTVLTTTHLEGNVVRIWNATTGEAMSEPIDCKFPVRCIEFSPDGTRMVVGGNGRLAWICDGRTGERLNGPFEYEGPIGAAAFTADGTRVAIGSELARIWDRTGTAVLAAALRHGSAERRLPVDSLAFSANGERLLVFGGGAAFLWDVQDGPARSLQLDHEQAVTFAEFSADGCRLVTAMDERVFSGQWSRPSDGRAAVVWDAQSGQRQTPPLLHERGVITAAFSPDAKRVVTASWDRTARLWDAETGESVSEPMHHPGAVRSANFSPDGEQIWTGCWNHSAWLWNGKTGEMIRDVLRNKGEVSDFLFFPVRTDDISADEKWIVTCSGMPREDAKGLTGMQVWNAQTGEPRFQREPFSYAIRTARFSPDGERLVTSSAHARAAHIWSARTGKLLVGPLQHTGTPVLHYADFSPDGTKVITAGHDGTACIWDSQTGRLTAQPLTHKGEVVHAAFSPDSKRIVTASWWDHAAFIWDAETGFQIGEPLQHDDWVTHATFSPDGKWVVTTSADKTARIWEVPMATASIPEWLPDLAEAIAGQQVNENGMSQPVPLDRLLELRVRLTANASTDPYTQWAQWFFSARSSRGLSASSGLSAER